MRKAYPRGVSEYIYTHTQTHIHMRTNGDVWKGVKNISRYMRTGGSELQRPVLPQIEWSREHKSFTGLTARKTGGTNEQNNKK